MDVNSKAKSFVIGRRVFSNADQQQYARASGDWNPIHVDAIASRRTIAGAIVAHGTNAVLWALDVMSANGLPAGFRALTVRFEKLIYLDTEVSLAIVAEDAAHVRAVLTVDGVVTTTLELSRTKTVSRDDGYHDAPLMAFAAPAMIDWKEVAGRTGCIGDASGEMRASSLFPHAASRFGAMRVDGIAALSKLVGMVCPGLHSMSHGFEINLDDDQHAERALRFRVVKTDERFRLIEMAVGGYGVSGTMRAFMCPPPIAQRSFADARVMVRPGEFAGVTALIVGGSRGIGAMTAKILAAGGARCVITYLNGESEANAIRDEIGETCRVLRFDVRLPQQEQLRSIDWPVNALYYFATDKMYAQRTQWYQPERFARHCEVYVDGFFKTCAALRERGSSSLDVFYPSSVVIDERPREVTEYAMAKSAGEMLCFDMNRFYQNVRVTVKRLPRILTDQTATLIPVTSFDALDVMLPIVREMHAASRSES